MRFGQGRDQRGTVVVLTLGTGVGSGVFIDGHLVPNVEFGTMEIRGKPAEWRSASSARTRRGLGWKAWALDLDEHLDRIDQLIWPSLIILGGGVSKNGDKFIPRLTVRCPVVAADLRNDAGIIGAAIVAAEGIPGRQRRPRRLARRGRSSTTSWRSRTRRTAIAAGRRRVRRPRLRPGVLSACRPTGAL